MNGKSNLLEGLTFDRLKSLIELEIKYSDITESLEKKKKQLEEKYKKGTIYFEYGSCTLDGPRYREMIYTEDSAIKIIKDHLDQERKYNERMQQENKELNLKIESLKNKIAQMRNFLK